MRDITVTGTASGDVTIDMDTIMSLTHDNTTVRIDDLLRSVAIPATITHCTAISDGGAYRASIPLDDIRSGGVLEVRRGGRPLAAEEGGPYRLRVLDGATLCWNVKSVEELRLSAGALPDDVPENPTHGRGQARQQHVGRPPKQPPYIPPSRRTGWDRFAI